MSPTPLHVERHGGGPGPRHAPITLVHGFTQTGRCWGPFDRILMERGPVATVDLPGHGRSGPATGDLSTTGRALVRATAGGTHLGYSLGGRALLHGALLAPEAVDRLVLIGAHPGIEDRDERRARRRADARLADRLERIGLARFLDEWLALPLFAGLDPVTAHREARLANDAHALADALRRLGTGSQEPLWDRLGDLTVPTLVLAGERDERYRAIGHRTAAAIGGDATFAVVPRVGHAAHLEDPEATGAIVVDWLAATEPPAAPPAPISR